MSACAIRYAWVLIALWQACGSVLAPASAQTAAPRTVPTERGLPIIENLSTSAVGADARNWSIVRDPKGLLYVGNTDGILEYDGVVWRVLYSRNGTPAYALAQSADGTLYFGLYGAFGRLVTDEVGNTRMDLLSDRLPEHQRDFTSVYAVHAIGGVVWFRSTEGLYRWDGSNISVIRPRTAFMQSYLVDGILYILEEGIGLHIVQRNSVILAPGGGALHEEGERIAFMLPMGNGTVLVGTKRNGMLVYDGKSFTPAWTPAVRAALPKEPTCGVLLADSSLAIGTSRGGIWILDRAGGVRMVLDGSSGLQDNSILSLLADDEGMLWAALDNGLSRIAWPSHMTVYGRTSGLEGRVVDLTHYRGRLYVSTTQGVFRLRPGDPGASQARYRQNTFELLSTLPPACNDLLDAGDHLLIATEQGVHSYDGRGTRLLSANPAWVFHSIHRSRDSILVGLNDGLLLLTRRGARWDVRPVFPVVRGRVNGIVELPDRSIWIGMMDGNVYRVSPQADFANSRVRAYDDFKLEEGSNPVTFGVLSGVLWLSTEDSLRRFDPRKDAFVADVKYWIKLGVPREWTPHMLHQDVSGSIWMMFFGKHRRYGYITPAARTNAPLTLLANLEARVVLCIKSDDDDVWFGTESELYRFDRTDVEQRASAFNVLIRVVSSGDSVLYLGSGSTGAEVIEIPHSRAGVYINFAAASFLRRDRTQYRWKLAGLDDTWSEWSLTNEMEYPGLGEGSYTFHVQARGADGIVSEEATVQVRVLPPWQRSWWAYALYVLLAIGVFVTMLHYRTRALAARSRALEHTVRERTDEIRTQAEKIRSQAEELETLDAIVRTVNKEVKLTDLLQALLRQTLLLFPNVDVACYFQRSPDDGLFRLVATAGQSVDRLHLRAFSLAALIDDQSNTINSLQDGVYVLRGLENIWNGEAASPWLSKKAFMGMSDMQQGVLRGFLVLGSTTAPTFSSDDLRRLLRLREHVSSAVAKAIAIRELEMKNALLDESNRQLRDTQQQLIVHEKLAALGELTAGIAHEIQNPLNFVNNFSSLSLELLDELEENLQTAPESSASPMSNLIVTIRGNCERIREHGMRATSIVSAMLMHTRKGSARRESIPFNEFLDQFVLLSYHGMRMLHPERDLKLLTDYDHGVEAVRLSPQEMSRVIVNICNNAWEAAIAKAEQMPQATGWRPEVAVRSVNLGDAVRVTIRDNGEGVPHEVRGRIFEPFFTTKHSGNNAGLGLSMSYEIVTRMHMGRLILETEPGSYSEFIIEIPKE
jgi:signal transduction histidine kinase/ligand-binding sensor domain-containing protein